MAIFNRQSTGYVAPSVISPIVAKSDYEKLLGKIEKLAGDDAQAVSAVYIPTISNISTASSVSNSWVYDAGDQKFGLGQIEAPTYLIQATYSYNELEEANLSKNVPSVGMQSLQDSLVDLAFAARVRSAVISGLGANEGLVSNAQSQNSAKALSASTPEDIYEDLVKAINNLLNSTFNRGGKIIVCGSYTLINKINTNILNTQKFIANGSTVPVSKALQAVLSAVSGKQIEFVYDNTIGDKKLLFVIPDLNDTPAEGGELPKLSFNIGDTFNTYFACSDIKDKTNPEINGVKSGLSSLNITSGVNARREASLVLTYS